MRGKVLGYSIAATYTGLTAGPVAGGLLNHQFGWRSIFILTFVTGAAVFLVAIFKLPKMSSEGNGQKLDLLGNLLYMAMIVSTMYGLSTLSSFWAAKYLIALGVLFFALFIYHELRIESPIIQIRLFRKNRSYLLSNLAALLNYGATFAVGYLVSIYLQVVKGYDSQISGIILISQPLIMALLSPYAGRLSDKISPFKLASLGMALCTAGLFSFAFISVDYPLYLIIFNLIIVGFGFAIFSSPNTNAVMACVEPGDYGVASSILATMRTLGQSSGMAGLTFIIAHIMGSKSFAEAEPSLVISAMRISFLIFALVCIAGVLFSMQRKDSECNI
jgi:MFS family permease